MLSERTTNLRMSRYSSRIYLQLASEDISVLKFLLEAEDNLAYLSTVNPHSAIVKLVYAPEQERDVKDFLNIARSQLVINEVAAFPENVRGFDESIFQRCTPKE